jgi:hypothetical protein
MNIKTDAATLLLAVMAQIATAGGIYAAIRSDLAAHTVQITHHEKRLDRLESK